MVVKGPREPEKKLEWQWNQDIGTESLGNDLETMIKERLNQHPEGLIEQIRDRFGNHYRTQRSKKQVKEINCAD